MYVIIPALFLAVCHFKLATWCLIKMMMITSKYIHLHVLLFLRLYYDTRIDVQCLYLQRYSKMNNAYINGSNSVSTVWVYMTFNLSIFVAGTHMQTCMILSCTKDKRKRPVRKTSCKLGFIVNSRLDNANYPHVPATELTHSNVLQYI